MGRRFRSRHRIMLGAEQVWFSALVERTAVTDDDGVRLGHAWTFAYVREPDAGGADSTRVAGGAGSTRDAGSTRVARVTGRTGSPDVAEVSDRLPADPARPVLFLFNGGPGVSSVWLHLSGLGPWRAVVPEDVTLPPTAWEHARTTDGGPGELAPREHAPARLAPSEQSLLDVADLVFIDPIETGFGRVAEGIDPARISGADRDAALTAQLVQRWLQRHGRLASPVYLLGESYGTIRAPLTATALLAEENLVVSGLAMLGQCLNAQETTQRPGNAAGFVAAIPLLAATAWYHGKSAHTARTLDEVVRDAHAFAVGEYAAALSSGEASAALVDRLAGFTGLTTEDLRVRRLRVDKEDYRRILLADRGLVLGLTDARYTMPASAVGASEPHVDAAAVRIDPVYGAAAHELFALLGLPADRRYRFAVPAHERWNYLEASAIGRFGGSGLPSPFAIFDYPAHLSALLRANADARLFFGTGHFDTLTTVGSLEHLKSQYGLPADRIAEGRYPAGHMMYTDPGSLAALAGDLRAFLRG